MESDLMHLFVKLNKLRMTMLFSELKEIGITGPQLFTMRELSQGRKTIGELAKAVELSYSTISGILDRMERNALIERIRDKEDRRVVWIQLTENCVMKEKLDKFNQRAYGDFDQIFSQEEVGTIKQVLEKLIVYMEKKLEGKA